MLKFDNYIDYRQDKISSDHKLPENIQEIDFIYNGGRVVININGQEFYNDLSAGTDFVISINKD